MNDLVNRLRTVTGGKLHSTNTSNALRIAAADRIEELEAALRYYAEPHDDPNDGPWGARSRDFGSVARAAMLR